jgi:hypothetical protein
MRRKGQKGSVFQKNRRVSDDWLPDETAYLRFWKDVPGKPEPRREVLALGRFETRSRAERKAADWIVRLGINSTQTFIETTSSTTFKEQAEWWLKSLSHRKQRPVEQTTIDNRRYALDKWIYPFLGDALLANVHNRALKDLVDKMALSLAPASIRDYVNIVKSVVASAVGEDGEEIFPRKWNDTFIDAPVVDKQDQHTPSTTSEGMTKILGKATGQYRMLYALLAGCGPLRVGEALGLEVDRHISEDFRTLEIVQKAKRGKIQPYLKTKNGARQVDLCSSLGKMLRDFIGDRKEGLLFRSSTGAQLLQSNALSDSLHPILEEIGHEKGGFNIFRRFRITYLSKTECPDVLKHFWSGHAHAHVSERYVKLLQERDFRLEWAERIGLGFQVPVGQLGQLHIVPRVA